MRVITVIVTHNRLELLKECIAAIRSQSRQSDDIIVINNGSTDNTLNWLHEQKVMFFTQPNTGGAGGFTTGIRLAYVEEADWIWLMDDDTIPEPDTLAILLDELESLSPYSHDVGFLSSTVLWTDGNVHQMNMTYPLTDKKTLKKLAITGKDRLPLIQLGTFVSMLISAKAVEKVGLPVKEYHIWNDDVEYSKRIIANGLAGIAIKDSIVRHATPANHKSDVFTDSPVNLWKYYYGMRNELFTRRTHEGNLQFWISWLQRMLIMPFRISINRKDYRWAFTKMIWRTSLAAIFFNPVIEFVNPPETMTL